MVPRNTYHDEFPSSGAAIALMLLFRCRVGHELRIDRGQASDRRYLCGLPQKKYVRGRGSAPRQCDSRILQSFMEMCFVEMQFGTKLPQLGTYFMNSGSMHCQSSFYEDVRDFAVNRSSSAPDSNCLSSVFRPAFSPR